MAEAKKKIKKMVVNRDLCIGAASCVVNAPGVYELDEENKAVFLCKDGTKSSASTERTSLADGAVDDDSLLAAAQSCPTKAIFVYDEDDKQIYP
jgi:ferredoxin